MTLQSSGIVTTTGHPGVSFAPSSSLLAIETSCDETAAAVMRHDGVLLSSILYSQHDVHRRYGGVVPELAARRHIETVESVIAESMDQAKIEWSDVHAIAVTAGPGLAGALLVGVNIAKALAYARRIPLIAVNHLEGHIASAWMERPDLPMPCVILVVSGGHTHLYFTKAEGVFQLIGQTMDDAAGEAFDKAAKMLGLGFPGGPALDRLARTGNPEAVQLPRPYAQNRNLNFSFSGIKTALLYHLRELNQSGRHQSVADIAASYQEAIVEVLVAKAFTAVNRYRARALAVVGGVSANSRLRTLLSARAEQIGISLAIPRTALCTDNAAMIAAAAQRAYRAGRLASWDLEADPEMVLPTIEPIGAPAVMLNDRTARVARSATSRRR